MYDMKALYEAESVEHAIQLRLEHPEAQIIAGGSDVLVQMREGKRAGKELISIYMIDAMRGVSIDEEENIRIGSLTSFSHITTDPILQKYINVLGEAVEMVGGPQIRAIGTIGGNTCDAGLQSGDRLGIRINIFLNAGYQDIEIRMRCAICIDIAINLNSLAISRAFCGGKIESRASRCCDVPAALRTNSVHIDSC